MTPAEDNPEAGVNGETRRATSIDRLIHEPSRMLIMAILYAGEQVSFLYLLNETGLTKGNLSNHLTRLEQAGYILIEKSFRGRVPQTLLSITPEGRSAFQIYRKQLKLLADALPTSEPEA